MNSELLRLIESAGVGGALGALMFVFYRRDAQRSQQQITDLATQYAALVDRVLALLESKTPRRDS